MHHYKEKSFFVCMPKNLALTQQQVDSIVKPFRFKGKVKRAIRV
jgi:hypothetical protein